MTVPASLLKARSDLADTPKEALIDLLWAERQQTIALTASLHDYACLKAHLDMLNAEEALRMAQAELAVAHQRMGEAAQAVVDAVRSRNENLGGV